MRPLYNELAQFYEIIEERDYAAEISLIDDVLRRSGARSLIDLGCGTGLHVRELAKRGYEALGIDISPQMVSVARRRARGVKNARFTVGDYYSYKPRKKFDAALCLNWSIPVKKEELDRFFGNTSRLLRESGVLIIDYERPGDIVWEDLGKPVVDSWNFRDGRIVRVSLGEVKRNVMRSRDVYIVFGRPAAFKPPSEEERYLGRWREEKVFVFLDVSHVRFYDNSELEKISLKHGLKSTEILTLKTRRGYPRLYNIFVKTGPI
ncbi:MAG: class I SAM-dependent methyltransferase [Nitrososphaerota archaeon]|nr:class I SAM-dependent methyltransferase [Candidatus Calditenuaceae archaeon]MDW8072791.1 class I SAM-dependent methyltransferase [Nitrososphaerota archaeon]